MDIATSTYGAFLIFLIVAIITIVICGTSTMRRRHDVHDQTHTNVMQGQNNQTESCLEKIKKVVSSFVRRGNESGEMEGKVVLRMEDNASTANTPPLWQRKIMMGERCEVPKFSGLILYDERGRAIHSNHHPCTLPAQQQEKTKADVTTATTTLRVRDLL